jgi:acetyltransferase-like isoleucine patch superfamily enzyme
MTKTYILGNGGLAKELYEQVFVTDKAKQFGGFITITDKKAYLTVDNITSLFCYEPGASFILGVGKVSLRNLFINHFSQYYELSTKHFPNIVSSKAYISHAASMGYGNVFCPFSLVNGDAKIANFNLFGIYSSISHDSVMGDNNVLSPYSGIMGNCYIGHNNFFSANSIVTPRLNIKNYNTVSAGEVVFDDMDVRQFFQSGIITKKR